MKKDYLVTKANTLITASYDLSLQEQKLILTLASMVQPNDEEFKEYEFKIKDFMELLGVETQTKYTEIPKITKELMKKVFEIKEGNDIVQLSWLSSARYKVGEGLVILKFDSSLKPYLLQLKKLYTSYKLENILSLKSKYSLRLYEILKSQQFKKYWEVDLEELKKIIGALEKSYLVYQNVKNRIILKAQQELKEKTDISFDFEEIKTGRKVTSIKFHIYNNHINLSNNLKKTNDISIIPEDETQNINKVLDIMENKISFSEAKTIYNTANGNLNLINKIYTYSKTQVIKKSLVGFMISMISLGEFKEPIKNNNEINYNGFNNFKARTYDYDDLEKKLLGWDDSKEEEEI